MKKLVSIGLTITIAVSSCSTSIYAFLPTDFHDPKCIDARKLGLKTDYITKKNKVCGCKTCSIDAVMYNRLDDYLTDLESQFESLSKAENYIGNEVKRRNIENILTSISDEIKREGYKNKNFLLASTNYDPNSPTSTAFFAKKDNIKYRNNYNETYFKEINDRAKNILSKVEKRNKLLEDSPNKFNYAEQLKYDITTLAISLISGAVIVFAMMSIPSMNNKLSEFFENKPNNANELIEAIKKMPEAEQNIIKKKF